MLPRTHVVTSNRESGFGRYDIAIEPKDKQQKGIILEFKGGWRDRDEKLEEAAKQAREQIIAKAYKQDMAARGVKDFVCVGVACRGKEVAVVG